MLVGNNNTKERSQAVALIHVKLEIIHYLSKPRAQDRLKKHLKLDFMD
jgi:hypothetical protein